MGRIRDGKTIELIRSSSHHSSEDRRLVEDKETRRDAGQGDEDETTEGGDAYQKSEQLDQRNYLTEAGGHYYTWVALTAATVCTRSRNDSYHSHFCVPKSHSD